MKTMAMDLPLGRSKVEPLCAGRVQRKKAKGRRGCAGDQVMALERLDKRL